MNKEELMRNLKYTEKKHRNDTVNTFDTDISMMCTDVLNVLKNCIEIPEGATNGDILCMLFPNMHYTLSDKSTRVVTNIGGVSSFDIDWWNAPYKKEVEE